MRINYFFFIVNGFYRTIVCVNIGLENFQKPYPSIVKGSLLSATYVQLMKILTHLIYYQRRKLDDRKDKKTFTILGNLTTIGILAQLSSLIHTRCYHPNILSKSWTLLHRSLPTTQKTCVFRSKQKLLQKGRT